METPNVNPSPKNRFLAYAPYVNAHRELIQKPEVQRAIDYALLEMLTNLTALNVDGSSAAARFYQMQGACDFATTLKKLGEHVQIPKAVRSERELDNVI